MPFAIAGLIEVPWHLTNRQHTFRFECIDLDGIRVVVPTPEGEHPLFLEGGLGRSAAGCPRRDADPGAVRVQQRSAADSCRRPLRVAAHDRRRDRRGLAARVQHVAGDPVLRGLVR